MSLSRETGTSERSIRRWKRLAVLAIEERLSKPLTANPTALHSLRMAMDRVHDEIVTWQPDFDALDPKTWKPRRRGPMPDFPRTPSKVRRAESEAPPSSHKPEDGDHPAK